MNRLPSLLKFFMGILLMQAGLHSFANTLPKQIQMPHETYGLKKTFAWNQDNQPTDELSVSCKFSKSRIKVGESFDVYCEFSTTASHTLKYPIIIQTFSSERALQGCKWVGGAPPITHDRPATLTLKNCAVYEAGRFTGPLHFTYKSTFSGRSGHDDNKTSLNGWAYTEDEWSCMDKSIDPSGKTFQEFKPLIKK